MANPIDTYRGQQGLAPDTGGYHPDPQLLAWIKQASAQTGADPVALLATALQESGGRLNGPAGDGGQSFGPYQFNIHGAGAGHTAAYDNSYAAVLNRAREFARLGVRGGRGAAAVQRPRDPQLYARGVDSLLARAHAILGGVMPSSGTTTPAVPAQTVRAKSQAQAALDVLNADSPGAALAMFKDSDRMVRIPGLPARSSLTPSSATVSAGSPVVGKFTLIGLPYQGTHTLYGNWESDNAIDIKVPPHTPVYATTDGVIGSQIGAISSSDPHMAGERLHLDGGGQSFYYQHLAQILVKAGQHVRAGQLLGYSGALNHVHFAVKNGDPRRYYK